MTIERISYHGWPESLLLSNGAVEAVVVPAIGRVMQFRFAGEETGAFWENRQLDGLVPCIDTEMDEWLNFGGDKTWPAPQSEWEDQAGQPWPPPSTFDSRPYHAMISENEVILTSDVDPNYGIKAVRQIRLIDGCPRLQIMTAFRKQDGSPVKVAVWVITQLSEPESVFVLLPERTKYPGGYQQQRGPVPRDLHRHGPLLSLKRDPREYIKIATEGRSMLWMNQSLALLICAEDRPDACPDCHTRTEVYTNPDPYRYVELETVGPIANLEVGEEIVRTNTYTLLRRSTENCTQEARRVFEI